MDSIAKNCRQRNINIDKSQIQDIAVKYGRFAELTSTLNSSLSRRNSLSAAIKAAPAEERAGLVAEAADLKPAIQMLESEKSKLEEDMIKSASRIPNTSHKSAPIGNESKIRIIEYINEENQYTSDDAPDHVEIARRLDLVDFDTAARVSGTGFYYLKNEAVLLELALTQYALKKAADAGFAMMRCPDLVRSEFVSACGFQPRDVNGQQIYETNDGNLSLVGTAEIPLAALGVDALFQESELPRRYVAVGRAFRAEAGARGTDTRGLYRVHEFTKIELFSFCTASNSDKELHKILELQKSIVKDLGLCARLLEMPTEELGASAHQKFDIEAWIPSRNDWGEITSASNCTDYQARRLNARYKTQSVSSPDDKTKATEFVHTLNGTAIAIPRLLVAGLESWTSHGVVKIPKCLRSYMGGIKEFGSTSKPETT